MWLYRTSGDTDKPIVLYEYQPGRGAKHPKEFLAGYKGYLHTDGYAGYMQKFSARYGIQDLHPHKLRHSFASIAITNGADIASVSEILGHSDKAVTFRMYTHADQASMTRASNIFREAIKRKQA